MIPLRDNMPTRRFPIVSVLLILANVVAFLIDQSTGHYEPGPVVRTAEGLVRTQQYVGGLTASYAMVPAAVTGDLAAAWPTVLTSMFLHAGWLHLGGNMLYLWIFGNNIEDVVGRMGFLAFYIACGTAAATAHIATNPESTVQTVGASGAIAGVMGAYIVLFPRAQVLSIVPIFGFGALIEVPALIVIGLWAVLQFVNASWLGGGEMVGHGGVAYFAHVGGFASGIVLIMLLGGRRLLGRRGPGDRRVDYNE